MWVFGGRSAHCWVSETTRRPRESPPVLVGGGRVRVGGFFTAAGCLRLHGVWVAVAWCVLFENCIVDASIINGGDPFGGWCCCVVLQFCERFLFVVFLVCLYGQDPAYCVMASGSGLLLGPTVCVGVGGGRGCRWCRVWVLCVVSVEGRTVDALV